MNDIKFDPPRCEHCKQTEEYLLRLDKGSARIMRELLWAITRKGVNEIHPTRELELVGKKQWFITNFSRPRFHGLIARVEDKKGYYCLTRKAGKFFRNNPIPQYAIVSKVTGHLKDYFRREELVTTYSELLHEDEPVWSGAERQMIDFLDPEEVTTKQRSLFDGITHQEVKTLIKFHNSYGA